MFILNLLFCFGVLQEMLESCSVLDIKPITEDDKCIKRGKCEVSFCIKDAFVKFQETACKNNIHYVLYTCTVL